jgi:hypothetical protein
LVVLLLFCRLRYSRVDEQVGVKMKISGLVLAALMCVANAAHSQDITWPQELTSNSGTVVVIYQPQGEEFSDNNLEARAAVSVKGPATGNTPVFGAIWFTAKIDTNRDTRTAAIRDIDVSDVRFADFSEGDREALAKFIEDSVGGATLVISVDQLLTDLDAANSGQSQADLKHTAPIIMLSTEPAILVSIDGDPVFQEIEGSRYERVVNSAFLIVRGGNNHYLYAGSNTWYQGSDVAGPWAIAANVPGDVSELVEPDEGDAEDLADTKIIIATEPSELLVTAGPPTWAPVEGMELLYLQNTDSNVFMELTTQKYYVLLSGRWYRGEGVVGDIEWVHVPNDELPMPFGDIPSDSVNGAVRSQVAGTQEARDAVLDNTIPQTAAIDRDDASFSVEYDGAPDFAPIEDIKVEYAQNTASAVFKYGNLYYACNDGVWYVANSATGPWSVATEIPDAIYKIPASNPHHNVTYVKVYDVTPEVVYVGYTPSYYGSYYSYGSVVYGTGWYYRPWYGPYYYPRYPTWGFHVTYNPWTGWGIGVSWTNGPFRFTFSRHGGWWGVGGYRPYGRAHVHGGYRKTNININNNININTGNIGNGNIGGGQNRPDTRPNLYDRPENRTRNAERPATADNRMAKPATGQQNNVLTDRSGNVYQRDNNGSWAQRENGQWSKPDNLDRSTNNNAASNQRPTTSDQGRTPSTSQQGSLSDRSSSSTSRQPATRPQLERDYNARQQGAQRTQNYQRQSSGQRRSSGGQRRR